MEWLGQTAKLLRLFAERGFQPGDKLPSERDLALLLGMSRVAVREALIRLDTLRIVECRPKAGVLLQPTAEKSVEAMVLLAESGLPLPPDEVGQSEDVRSILEVEAVHLACVRRTHDDLDRIATILGDSAVAIHRGESLADLDAAFHKAVCAGAKNDVLLQFVNVFYLMSRKRREVHFKDADQARRSHTQHTRIFGAIVKQDTELAQGLLRQHLKTARAKVLAVRGEA